MAKNFEVAAAIDVGSNYLQMTVAQISAQGKITLLEDLVQPTDIGRDTFAGGRIERETVLATCTSLKGFAQLLRDYQVKFYKAVSTSGIREAINRDYVLEQLRLRTKLEVEVINSAQERFFMYKALRSYLPNPALINSSESTLVVNIASGGVETSIYEKGNLKLTEYIKIGSLRLRETMADLETKTVNFPGVMEEFIESKLYLLKSTVSAEKPANFVVLGGEARSVLNVCMEGDFLEPDAFEGLYNQVRHMSDDQIARTYNLSANQAETFLPTVIILYCFLKMTRAKRIFAPAITLKHGLLCELADQLFDTPHKEESLNDIINSVWYIAKKFGADKKHAVQVEALSLSIFDQTWRLHRLGERERLYLQVAAILHAIGYYVNFANHHIHGHNMIRTQNLMGFSDRELDLVANVVRYHVQDSPSHFHGNYAGLSEPDKMTVSKLAAILRLAECLDVSHLNKVDKLEINLSGEQLLFHLNAGVDTLLEEWYFRNNTRPLEEVTGVQVVIKRKG